MQNDTNTTTSEMMPFYRGIERELELIRDRLDESLQSDDELVDALCLHVSKYRGKMLRPAVLLLSGQACGTIGSRHIEYGTIIELLHLATLIHDDILDQAEIRRGSATTSQLWGNEASVLLGDYLLSKAFDLCNRLGDLTINRLISESAQTVCRGELLQCLTRQQWDLAEARYLQIIHMKTGVLYQVCCRIGAAMAEGSEEEIAALEEFGRLIGQSFQIVDDLLDITGREAETGKTLGTDLIQGKPTLPIIHFKRQASEADRLRLTKLLNSEPSKIAEIRALLEASGSLQYTQELAWALVGQAREKLQTLKASRSRESLAELAEFVVKRPC
jgi:octaprenyl-diphosphate synthase